MSELLKAFRTGEGVDLIRDSVRMVMQELIEPEAAPDPAPTVTAELNRLGNGETEVAWESCSA